MLTALSGEGIHEQRARLLFTSHNGMKYTGDRPVFSQPLVVLACTNRCGSNLMADYLRQTGIFAGLNEFLNADTMANQVGKNGCTSLPDYISHLVFKVTPKQDRLFGVKASWDQLAMLLRARIPSMFPGIRVVHVWRQDLVGQAVSLLIASQTNKWTSLQQATTDQEPHFDSHRIDKIMQSIRSGNDQLAMIASALSLCTASVCYEDLLEDPLAALQRVARRFDLDLGDWVPGRPAIAKQADALNEQFVRRFRAEVERTLFNRA